MKKPIIWIIFFSLTSIFALIQTLQAGKDLYFILNLKGTNTAHIIKWQITSVKDKSFFLTAFYTFEVSHKIFEGKTRFIPPYLNLPSAQNALKDLSKDNWIVFFNESNPKKSTLQRNIPIKKSIYALLLYGILFYFMLLRKRSQKYF